MIYQKNMIYIYISYFFLSFNEETKEEKKRKKFTRITQHILSFSQTLVITLLLQREEEKFAWAFFL